MLARRLLLVLSLPLRVLSKFVVKNEWLELGKGAYLDVELSVLAHLLLLDGAAQLFVEELQSVADAEQRQAAAEQSRVALRRVGRVHRVRTWRRIANRAKQQQRQKTLKKKRFTRLTALLSTYQRALTYVHWIVIKNKNNMIS